MRWGHLRVPLSFGPCTFLPIQQVGINELKYSWKLWRYIFMAASTDSSYPFCFSNINTVHLLISYKLDHGYQPILVHSFCGGGFKASEIAHYIIFSPCVSLGKSQAEMPILVRWQQMCHAILSHWTVLGCEFKLMHSQRSLLFLYNS